MLFTKTYMVLTCTQIFTHTHTHTHTEREREREREVLVALWMQGTQTDRHTRYTRSVMFKVNNSVLIKL